jgi:putative tricarboxylic transport membrane protein
MFKNKYLQYAFAYTCACVSTLAHAQEWRPTRNIEIVVGSGAASAQDREARELQRHLQKLPGMPPITVNNRPGGGGAIAVSSLQLRQGDAHTFSTMSVSLLTNHILGLSPLRYQDLTPMAIFMREYSVVWTRAESPIKSLSDLTARLKANPASLTFGISPALGNQSHIVLGMIARAIGVDPKQLKIVVYAGGAGVTAALGGHVDVWVGNLGNAITLAHAGRINLMGVSAPQRLPGRALALPTFREQGVDAVFAFYRGLIAPAGLTPAQRAYWDATFAGIARSEAWKQTALEHAWEPDFKNSAETRRFLDAEYVRLRKILTDLGLAKTARANDDTAPARPGAHVPAR